MTDTITLAASCVLALAAIAVAAKEPRHRPFAVYAIVAALYVVAITIVAPYLASLPRPLHGSARLLLHATQAAYLAVPALFVDRCWAAFSVRRDVRPLPYFLAAIAMVCLVNGYGRGSEPGLYRVGSVQFRSASLYLVWAVVNDLAFWMWLVPRVRRSMTEVAGTYASTTLVAFLVLGAAGSFRIAFSFAARTSGHADWGSAVMAGAAAIVIGLHVPLLFSLHLGLGGAGAARRRRSSQRAVEMDRIRRRVQRSEFTLRRWTDGADLETLDRAMPAFMDLARSRRAGAAVMRIGTSEAGVARAVEIVAAVAGAFDAAKGAEIVALAKTLAYSAVSATRDAEPAVVSTNEFLRSSGRLLGEHPVAPFCLMLFSALDGAPLSAVVDALDVVAALLEPAASPRHERAIADS